MYIGQSRKKRWGKRVDYIALNHHLKSADIHVAKESRQLIVSLAGPYAAAARSTLLVVVGS